MKLLSLGFVISCLFATVAQAGPGEDDLQNFFAKAKTLRADFIQYRTDKAGRVLNESKGILLIQKPGKVRLEYKLPYKQLYVSDGDKLWSFDPDLEQAIVKKMDSTLGDTPILLLTGHSRLQDSFTIKELIEGKERHTLNWVELTPKNNEAAFERVRIAFTRSHHELRIMELEDAMGNSTFIEFHNVERNITHSYNAFKFIPPEGVDVITDL